jgi:hypothetical protein
MVVVGGKSMACQRRLEAGQRSERTRPEQAEQPTAEQLIPVGNIFVDCTPVTFKSPGMVRSIISCVVDEVVVVPVTRTVIVETPVGNGCVVATPIVTTIPVPVLTTVNVPCVLTPIPKIICPR